MAVLKGFKGVLGIFRGSRRSQENIKGDPKGFREYQEFSGSCMKACQNVRYKRVSGMFGRGKFNHVLRAFQMGFRGISMDYNIFMGVLKGL